MSNSIRIDCNTSFISLFETTDNSASSSHSAHRAQLRAQNFTPTTTFDPNPGLDKAGKWGQDWINDRLDEPSNKWVEKFYSSVNKVREALLIHNENIEQLNQLIQQIPPVEFEENLSYQRKIEKANCTVSEGITILYNRICKAQDIKHNEKPNFLIRSGECILDKINDKYLKPIKNTLIPNCRIYTAQIRDQNNLEINKDMAYIHVMSPWSEFNKLYNEIAAPQTSDDERGSLLAQLGEKRDRVNQIAAAVSTDFTSLPSEQRKVLQNFANQACQTFNSSFLNAKFYANPIAHNIEEIQNFRQQDNNADYLHYSSLFIHKLLNNNQTDSCMEFATEWMKSAGRETPTANILQMGSAFIAAAQTRLQEEVAKAAASNGTGFYNPVNPGFYESFNEWMKAHPTLEVTPEMLSAKIPNDELSESELLELLRGNLARFGRGDPTYDEMQSYLKCDQIIPAAHWKIKQGEYHLSCLQFEETRRLIATLPDDSAGYLKQMLTWNQYRTACTVLDIGLFILQIASQNAPEGKVKTALQLVNAPLQFLATPLVAKECMPTVAQYLPGIGLDYPAELRKHPDFSDNNLLDSFYLARTIIPVLSLSVEQMGSLRTQEAWNRCLRPIISLGTDGPMAFMGGRTIYHLAQKNPFASPLSAANISSLAIQVSTSAISLICVVNKKIKNRLSPTWRALEETAYSVTSALIPINLIHRSKEIIFSAIKRFLPRFITGTAPISAGVMAIQAVVVVYQIGKKFCPRKTAYFLMDAHEFFMAGDYDEGEILLKSTKNLTFIDNEKVDTLLNCLEFFKLYPHLRDDKESQAKMADCLKDVDCALTELKANEAYEPARNSLLVNKIGAFLKCGEKQKAADALIGAEMTIALGSSIASFLIAHATNLVSMKQHDEAIGQIEVFSSLEQLKDFKSLLDKYKKYIADHKADATAELLIKSLDDTIKETKDKPHLLGTALNLHWEKISLYLSVRKYSEANQVLNDKNVSSDIYAKTADTLIRSARTIGEINSYANAHQYLKETTEKLKWDKNFTPLVVSAIEYLALRANNPPDAECAAIVKAIDDLTASTGEHLPHLNPLFQLDKVLVLIKSGKMLDAGSVVQKLKTALQDQVALYFIRETQTLCKKKKYEEAVEFMTQATTLEFKHNQLISNYKDYVSLMKTQDGVIPDQKEAAFQFIQVIDALLPSLARIKQTEELVLLLTYQKLAACINIEDYKTAKDILNQLPSQILLKLALHIIDRAEIYRQKVDIDDSIAFTDRVTTELPLTDIPIIKSYKKFLKAAETLSPLRTEGDERTALDTLLSIDNLRREFGNLPIPLSLQTTEVDLYIQFAQFNQRKHNFTEAISFFKSAIKVLPEGCEQIAEQLQRNIAILREQPRK